MLDRFFSTKWSKKRLSSEFLYRKVADVTYLAVTQWKSFMYVFIHKTGKNSFFAVWFIKLLHTPLHICRSVQRNYEARYRCLCIKFKGSV